MEAQEMIKYECSDGSQVIIATSEEVIAAAGCDISAFAEGQVLEVLHEPGSGNIIVQANFTTTTDDSLNDGTMIELEGQSIEVDESESDSNTNPYKCRTCKTTFRSKKTLKLHSTVHVDEAYYACEFCSATKIHWTEMCHHQCLNVETTPIVCPQCHKTVSTKKQLQVHDEIHNLQRRFTSKRMNGYFQRKLQETEDQVVDWGAKPFICGVCGKPFGKLYELEYHEKLHNGERQCPNNCDKCGLSYINRHDLNKHMAMGCTGEISRKTDAPFLRRQPDDAVPISTSTVSVYTSS